MFFDDLAAALTPEAARVFADWRVSGATQDRIDELADKANEGELTPEERDEYECVVRAGNLVSILRAKSRAVLRDSET
jgi:hypothetical protein